ncbi:MAG: DUF2868 domain-containing protein [Burkholderiales bacterium]|nr:DUF2868 domain-containing protein [Burkholderiales bacterium]
MNETDARNALLLRAYETAPPAQTDGRWNADDRLWATQAALQREGAGASTAAFIARRARLAAERLCAREPGAGFVLRALAWRAWIGWAFALLAFVAGVATDAIGPAQRINVLAPPLLALLAWNLLVYAAMLARVLTRRRDGVPGQDTLARLIARALRAIALGRGIERLAPPLAGFARDWAVASARLSASRVARMLHAAAAALAAGALFGMYLRGFALEYRAGWESTFLDASAVHAILSFVLGPAAAISGIALPDAGALAAIRSNMSPGENAARWIHLYALTMALFVIVPRALMALAQFLVERRLANSFPLPLDDGYFQAIARAQHGVVAEVRVVPYSIRPGAQATAGLNTLLARVFGPRTELAIAPTVPFGAEDALDPALIPGAPLALVAALFALTATPERENHGAFIDALAARMPPATPFAVLIDESAFRQRFDASGAARREERRAAWRRMLTETGREPVFVDLEAQDCSEAERALRAQIESAPVRTGQD